MKPTAVMIRLLLLVLVPLGGLVLLFGYVRVNISPSLPYGLYRIHSMDAVTPPLTPGTLVVVSLPAWRDMPLLKPVAAAAGDRVCRLGGRLVIEGMDYGSIFAEWNGQPLPTAIAPESCLVILPGEVFLATAAPQSLDSRYYGPVAVEQISAMATPLVTWGPVYAATPLY
jgi:type IV secretory pathway protease TraF